MGVYARKGKRGTTFTIDFTDAAGRRHRIGGFKTKREAQAAYEATVTDVRRGISTFTSKTASPGFQDFAEEFFQWSKSNKRSWERDKISLQHLVRFFVNRQLSAITSKDIESYKTKRLRDGVQKPTVNRELRCLSTLFNKAKKWKRHIGENPVAAEIFFHEDPKKGYVLKPHEEAKLLEAAASPLREFILFGLHTGLRRGQILSLTWNQVDLANARVFLPASGNKDKKDHTLPLSQTAVRVLRSLPREGQYCFIGVGNKWQVYSAFKRTLRAAGLPQGIRIHDLRHTFLTRLGERERSTFVVQMLAQHSNVKTTERYVHPSEQAMIQALERMESGAENVTICHKFENEEKVASAVSCGVAGGLGGVSEGIRTPDNWSHSPVL
jgi:integrase